MTFMGGLRRYVVGMLAVVLTGVLVAAVVAGWRAAEPEGWWAVGYYRLVVDAMSDRFDHWARIAAPAAIVLGIAIAIFRRAEGVSRFALGVVALVLGIRAAVEVDVWRAGRGPNLILISIDTLRADRLGAYGYSLPTSPTFDKRIAGEGVTFEEVYSQSPKTTPSHMTLFTSLYPCVHGVHLWWSDAPARVLSPAVHTLAEILKNAGYSTAAFTGGGHVDKSRGFGQGFDRYSHTDELHNDELPKTLHWLNRHTHRKFFLFFHTYRVHDPYVQPLEYIRMFDGDYRGHVLAAVERLLADGTKNPKKGGLFEERNRIFWDAVNTSDPADVTFVSRLYDAGIRHMDDAMLKPLLDRLEKLDLARDTLVVFLSDHGEAFGEHQRFLHEDLHGETLRVPLVLRFPGRLPAGVRVGGRARLLDVMPTILDLLHVPAPPDVQGESLVPRIGAKGLTPGDAVSEFSLPWKGTTYEALRRGNLSYTIEGTKEQLFDLTVDPGEQHDLATSRPNDVGALRTTLDQWRNDCRVLAPRLGPGDTAVAPSAERIRQLKSLGYLE